MLGFRNISGLSFQQATDGLLKISEIPGDGGVGPSGAVITATASGLPPNNPAITIQLFPSGNSAIGTDSNGNISIQATFVNNGDDKHFSIVSDGIANFLEGFWNQAVRMACNNATGTYQFGVQFNSLEPIDFNQTLTDTPHNPVATDVSYDPDADQGQADITFQYDNADAENPDSLAILRDGVFIASVPWENGTVEYTYTDTVFAIGIYTYTIQAYRYGAPDEISAESTPVIVDFTVALPDISITGSGGIDFGGSAPLVFIADPSGIYTLVPDKTHDTLYERLPAVTSVDVKIPDPFVITGFFGD